MEGNKDFFRGSLTKWLRTMVIVSSQDLGGWKRPRTPSGRTVLAKQKNGGDSNDLQCPRDDPPSSCYIMVL